MPCWAIETIKKKSFNFFFRANKQTKARTNHFNREKMQPIIELSLVNRCFPPSNSNQNDSILPKKTFRLKYKNHKRIRKNLSK